MSKKMIPDDELIAAGYRPFAPNRQIGTHQYCDRAFQFRVRHDRILYSLNIYQYDAHHDHPGTESSEAEAVMCLSEAGPWVTIEMHKCGSREETETFFWDLYHQMKMVPDASIQD